MASLLLVKDGERQPIMDKLEQVKELLKEPHAGDEYVIQAILDGRVCLACLTYKNEVASIDLPDTNSRASLSVEQYPGGYYEGDIFVSTNVELMRRIFEVQDGNLYFRDRKRSLYLHTKFGKIALHDSDVELIKLANANPAVIEGDLEQLRPAQARKYELLGRPKVEDVFYMYDHSAMAVDDGKNLHLYTNFTSKWYRRKDLSVRKKTDTVFPPVSTTIALMTLEENSGIITN